jgi:hypothetical protein
VSIELNPRPWIFTAIKMESAAVVKALAGCSLSCDIQLIGMRACRLPADLAESKPSVIIMAGLAGALDPAAKIGDIFIDDPGGLLGEATTVSPIHTADQIIATAAHKAELFRQTGAPAVDMENAIVRRAAEQAAIPFIGIRAISDRADQSIDPVVLSLVDEIGQPRPLAIAGLLIRKPGMVSELRQLQRQGEQAAAALGAAVRRAVEML